MSEFRVCFTKVKEINPHPNKEVHSLEIITVYGFNVVSKKGLYNIGDFVCYCPIDSVLPKDLEDILFPEGSKIKLNNSRVRQIRIQKYASQGLLIDVSKVKELLRVRGLKSEIEFKLEVDIAPLLNIKKYEPPLPAYLANRQNGQTRKERPMENPLLHKYNGLENIKWYPDLFQDGEEVVIQEKLHGSNCRAGMLPMVKPKIGHITDELKARNFRNAFVLAKKYIKLSLSKEVQYEVAYGSNNVELTNRAKNQGYYGTDVYGAVLQKVGAFEKIQPNEVIYGEVIGQGIQKNYNYGHTEHHFVLFDVKIVKSDGSTAWLNPQEVKEYAEVRGFDIVPTLYEGPYNKQLAYELTKGPSVYCPEQKVREGVVIKAKEYNNMLCPNNRKSLKWISEDYLDDKNNTDFH